MLRDTDQLTRAEAAQVLGVTSAVMAKMACRKQGPQFYKLTGRLVRYTRSDLLKWREDHLVMGGGK